MITGDVELYSAWDPEPTMVASRARLDDTGTGRDATSARTRTVTTADATTVETPGHISTVGTPWASASHPVRRVYSAVASTGKDTER